MTSQTPMTLAFEPGSWTIELHDGSTIEVRADSFAQEGDTYEFSLFIDGQPMTMFKCLSIPGSLVKNVEGGPII